MRGIDSVESIEAYKPERKRSQVPREERRRFCTMGTCYFCGADIDIPVYRSTLCPACGRDVKICLNCVFYSPGSHWECRETIPEAVRDKERANFCDYFRLGSRSGKNSGGDNTAGHRKAFDDLFGD